MSLNEEEIIKARPLLFESRPFTRITKRITSLTSPGTTTAATSTTASTSSPAASTSSASAPSAAQQHEEIDLDFTHFASVLTRIQLLQKTNAAEVARYSREASSITSLSHDARTALHTLRNELERAQREKAHKLHYDAIATEILDAGLKPRDEVAAAIARLHADIAELEREREEYRAVWAERRSRFDGIVRGLEEMWAQIKAEKDEQDRRDGLSESEGEEGEIEPGPAAGGGGAAGAGVGVGGGANGGSGVGSGVGSGAKSSLASGAATPSGPSGPATPAQSQSLLPPEAKGGVAAPERLAEVRMDDVGTPEQEREQEQEREDGEMGEDGEVKEEEEEDVGTTPAPPEEPAPMQVDDEDPDPDADAEEVDLVGAPAPLPVSASASASGAESQREQRTGEPKDADKMDTS